MIFILLGMLLDPISIHAKDLKEQIKAAFEGKMVYPTIWLGRTAVPQGYQTDYPVSTILDVETHQVAYRVEWAFVRFEAKEEELRESFPPGTPFRIVGLKFKDDRIEAKLKTTGGTSTKLKLILGKGWQSRQDAATVEEQISAVLAQTTTDQQSTHSPTGEPVPHGTLAETEATTSLTNGTTSPPVMQGSEPAGLAAYVGCRDVSEVKALSLPNPSGIDLFSLSCSQPVRVLSEEGGWLRIRDDRNELGYLPNNAVTFVKPGSDSTVLDAGSNAVETGSDLGTESTPLAADSDPSAAASTEGNTSQSIVATPQPRPAESNSTILWGGLGVGFLVLIFAFVKASRRRKLGQPEVYVSSASREPTPRSSRPRSSPTDELAAEFSNAVDRFGPAIVDEFREEGMDVSDNLAMVFAFDVISAVKVVAGPDVSFADAQLVISVMTKLGIIESGNTSETIKLIRGSEVTDNVLLLSLLLLFRHDQKAGTYHAKEYANTLRSMIRVVSHHHAHSAAANATASKLLSGIENILQGRRPFSQGEGFSEETKRRDKQRSDDNEQKQHDTSDNGTRRRGRPCAGQRVEPDEACARCSEAYSILDLKYGSSKQEVKSRRRQFVELFHPDRLEGRSANACRMAEEKLKRVNAAVDEIMKCNCAQ